MLERCLALGLLAAAAMAQPYATNGDERLAGLIEEALRRHPAVEQSLARYRASLQMIPQAQALPEPRLSLQLMQARETRVMPNQRSVMIEQAFPWFGKLDDQGQIASKDAAVERERHELQKVEVIRRVKQSYYELGYLDLSLAITEEDLGLLEQFERLARARYTQGAGLQQAVVKLQAEITRDRNRLQMLRAQRVDAEAALNTLLDRAPSTPVAPIEMQPRWTVMPELQALYAKGRRHRPELKASLLEIEKNEKRIQAARKEFWPDFWVGAGLTNFRGTMQPADMTSEPQSVGMNSLNLQFGVTLPIRRRKYNAAVLEASEEFVAARQGYRAVENEVEEAIRAVAFRLTSLEEQASLFRRVLLPQAEQALRSTEAAYASGLVSVVELLDSERTLLEVRLGLAGLEADYMKTLAEMERALGKAFPEEQP